jgi:hypothetical protein
MRKKIFLMAVGMLMLSLSGHALAEDYKLLNDMVPTRRVWKLRPLEVLDDNVTRVYKTGFAKELDFRWTRLNDTSWRLDYGLNPEFRQKAGVCRNVKGPGRRMCLEVLRRERHADYVRQKFESDFMNLHRFPVKPGLGVKTDKSEMDAGDDGSIIVEVPEWRPGLSLKMGFGTVVWDSVEECMIDEPLTTVGENILAVCDVSITSNWSLEDGSLTMDLTSDHQYSITVGETGWFTTRNVVINTSDADYETSLNNYGNAVHENLDLMNYNAVDLNHYGNAKTIYKNGLNKEGAYAYLGLYDTSDTRFYNVTMPSDCSGYLTYFYVDDSARVYADNLTVCPTSGSQYFSQYMSCVECLINGTGPTDAILLDTDYRCYAGSGEHCLLDGYISLNQDCSLYYDAGTATRIFPSCAYTDDGVTPVGAGVEYEVYYDGVNVGSYTTDSDGCVRFPVTTSKSQEDGSADLDIYVDGTHYRTVEWQTATDERDSEGRLAGLLITNVAVEPPSTTTSTTETTTSSTTTTSESTTTTLPEDDQDSVIRSKNNGLKLLPADGRLYFGVSGFTMVRPDGVLVCCGPDNGNEWSCVEGACF